MRSRAFTLIELLICILIVSILAAIILPAYSRAIGTAHRVERIARLKQLTVGLHLYREDFDGYAFPEPTYPETKWYRLIATYVGSTLIVHNPDYTGKPDSQVADLGHGFSFSGCLMSPQTVMTPNPVTFFETAPLGKPNHFIDMSMGIIPDALYAPSEPSYSPIGGKFLADHDRGGSVYAFWDGSAKYLKLDSVAPKIVDSCEIPVDKFDEAFFQTRIEQ